MKTMTEQMTALKEEALAVEPLRKNLSLHEIEFVKPDLVNVMGRNFLMERDAFKDLLKLLGVTLDGGQRIIKDEEVGSRIINLIKMAISKARTKKVQIVVNRRSGSIIRIYSKESAPMISVNGFFEVVDRLLNTDNFSIFRGPVGAVVDDHGMITINLLSENDYQVTGLKKEIFKTGISISNKGGIKVNSFNERLICGNGNTMRLDGGENVFLRHMSELDQWLHDMSKLKQKQYINPVLEERIRTAMNTKASFGELRMAKHMIGKAIGEQFHRHDEVERYCPVSETMAAFAKFGIDTEGITSDQAMSLRTAVPMWDLINGITDFASHNVNGWKVSESERMQMLIKAGKTLVEKFDCENMVPIQAFN